MAVQTSSGKRGLEGKVGEGKAKNTNMGAQGLPSKPGDRSARRQRAEGVKGNKGRGGGE